MKIGVLTMALKAVSAALSTTTRRLWMSTSSLEKAVRQTLCQESVLFLTVNKTIMQAAAGPKPGWIINQCTSSETEIQRQSPRYQAKIWIQLHWCDTLLEPTMIMVDHGQQKIGYHPLHHTHEGAVQRRQAA